MKVKTAQVLQIIATVLYLLAFIACVVSIFFQYEIKSLMSASPEVLNIRSVPYHSLVTSLVLLFLAVVYLILVLSVRSRGGSIASVIVMAFFTILLLMGLLTAGKIFITWLVGRSGGAEELASYSALESAVSYGSSLLLIPATAFEFMSMGGFCGKPRKEKKEAPEQTAQPVQPAQPVRPVQPVQQAAPVVQTEAAAAEQAALTQTPESAAEREAAVFEEAENAAEEAAKE